VLRKIVASMALAITALATVMSLAHADALDDIKKAGKIRIAIDLGVPPYGMTDDKLQPTGLDVETARLLAKDWGLEFEHVPTTGASRIPALQTGKADLVISSLSYTAERANGHRCPEVRRPQVAGRSRWEDGWHGARHDARHAADKRGAEGDEAGPLRG
jgi:ABC-type amino acid transport substrate-binding protein